MPSLVRNIQKTVLPNGLRVVTEYMPTVRSIAVGVWVNSGSRHEAEPETGITHFTEHMVFKGTENFSAQDIAISIDSLGGHLDAFTSKETTAFTAKVLDEHLPQALDMLADMVQRPTFVEDDIEREKGVVLEELKMDEDNPDLSEKSSPAVFGADTVWAARSSVTRDQSRRILNRNCAVFSSAPSGPPTC